MTLIEATREALRRLGESPERIEARLKYAHFRCAIDDDIKNFPIPMEKEEAVIQCLVAFHERIQTLGGEVVDQMIEELSKKPRGNN